jgi:hypothetical protein
MICDHLRHRDPSISCHQHEHDGLVQDLHVTPQPPELPPGAVIPKSRWVKGTLTFGPVGRIAWSVAFMIPEVWLFTQSILAVFALALWTFWVLPPVMRQIWKRSPAPVRRNS